MSMHRPPRFAPVAIACAILIYAAPLAWLLLSSVKPASQLATDPYSLWPHRWQWSNYVAVWREMPFALYLANSILLTVGSIAGTLISCSLAAYAFARLRWPGRNVWFALLISTMLLPWHVTMIPRFLVIRSLGLYDSLAALILPTFLGNALYIFLLRQFFVTIPEELRDAARIDGLSEWGIWRRIFLPLSKPALLTVVLFQGVATWNDLSGPLLYLNDPHKFPLAYGLERFVSAYSDQTHLLLPAAVLFTLPLTIVFLVAQRAFTTGVATSGIGR